MSFTKVNYVFIIAYFIIPILVLTMSPIDSIGPIELSKTLRTSLLMCLSITTFSYFLVSRLVKRNINRKIDIAISKIKLMDDISVNFFFIPILFFFLSYGTWLFFKIDESMTRDDRFSIIENQSVGPLFMLMIKFGVLLSVISLLKGRKFFAYIFVLLIAFITFQTLSRSLLVLVVLPLLPFINVSYKTSVIILLFIFFSRYIFTNNLSFTWDWWIVFGFGEMLGVLFGPLTILKLNPSISLIESLGFSLNALPGLSFLTSFLDDNGRIPEIAIYVNNLTNKYYGIFGVASTPYTDILLSPITFLVSLLILCIIFLYLNYSNLENVATKYFICSIYLAFGFSITSFYRWSFSGAVYTLTRDALLFFVLFLFLNTTNRLIRNNFIQTND